MNIFHVMLNPIKIGTFFKVPLYIHASLTFTTLALFYLSLASSGVKPALVLLFVIGMLVLTVVLHEYGHAIAGSVFGYPCKKITLFIFGGAAEVPLSYDNPKAEFWITLCGPLVNFISAMILLPFVKIFPENVLLIFLFEVNVILLAFNLLPVFPLDGGRLLRSLVGLNISCPFKAAKFAHYFSMFCIPILGIGLFMYWGTWPATLVLVFGLLGTTEYPRILQERKELETFNNLIHKRIESGHSTVFYKGRFIKLPETFPEALATCFYYKTVYSQLNVVEELLQELGVAHHQNIMTIMDQTRKNLEIDNLDPDQRAVFDKHINSPPSLQTQVALKIIDMELKKLAEFQGDF
ncbi:MAG: hypothetical protein DWQ19_09395 [Crenarchaeota archaeon]|mgnify:CR=1 FL=1|nr:MAG: hypothetical protein DWQ19_09395 [Thermoproteota archaeon]